MSSQAEKLIERVLEGESPKDVINEYRTWASAGPRAGGSAEGLHKTLATKYPKLVDKLFANWAHAQGIHAGPGRDMAAMHKEFMKTGWMDFMQALMYQLNKVVAVPEGKQGPGLQKIATRISNRYGIDTSGAAEIINFLMSRYSGGQRD